MANCEPKQKKVSHPHVEVLIRRFGGAAELSRKLSERKLSPITEDGINKWRWRGEIPMDRLLDLQKLGRIENKPVNIVYYAAAFRAKRRARLAAKRVA